ncbi:MAG: two-component system sensor histidine kinase DesK [Polaribacter sp.]|jgi:two-component system sensor histidine kinase DesK
MLSVFKKIDRLLLPPSGGMHYAPYIWLVYLLIFFISLASYHPIEYSYLYASMGTIFFLIVYFNSYWVSAKRIKWNILSILIIGTALAQLTPGASVFFVYAGAFCCRLGRSKTAFIALLIIAVWIGVSTWLLNLSAFFYVPAIAFSFLIGGINIYQHDIDIKNQELKLSQQEVRHLARTSERERIARDLHDLIGHTFSVITLKAELAGKLIDKEPLAAKLQIKELENISRDALKQIREVVTGYRTSDLNTELAHAKYVLQSNDVIFEYQFDEFPLDDDTNKELAIILKEAVTNILKHSNADKVLAIIRLVDGMISMVISDNGVGFSEQSNRKGFGLKGFGLKGMFERVKKLSGDLVIDSKSGTMLTISIPITTPITGSMTASDVGNI